MEGCPIKNINMLRLMKYEHRLEELDVALNNLSGEIGEKIELAYKGKISRDEFPDVLVKLSEWVAFGNKALVDVKDFTKHIIVLNDGGKDE